MATWADVEREAGDLAAAVRERFEAFGLGLLATLRKDGSPRISGVEPMIWDGELWMGMMPDSLKAKDLTRDPRFALHSATTDKQVTHGDARVSGRAVEVHGVEERRRFLAAFKDATGTEVPDGPMHLFRADVQEVMLLRPGGDHLLIDSWREGRGLRHVDRY